MKKLFFTLLALPSFLALSALGASAPTPTLKVDPAEAANVLAHCPEQAKELISGGKWIGGVSSRISKSKKRVEKKVFTFQSYRLASGFAKVEGDKRLKVTLTVAQADPSLADAPATLTYTCN